MSQHQGSASKSQYLPHENKENSAVRRIQFSSREVKKLTFPIRQQELPNKVLPITQPSHATLLSANGSTADPRQFNDTCEYLESEPGFKYPAKTKHTSNYIKSHQQNMGSEAFCPYCHQNFNPETVLHLAKKLTTENLYNLLNQKANLSRSLNDTVRLDFGKAQSQKSNFITLGALNAFVI